MRLTSIIYGFFWGILLFAWQISAQTKGEIERILEKTNVGVLKQTQQVLISEYEQIHRFVQLYGTRYPKYIQNTDGSFDELSVLLPNGTPLYYAIDNVAAAISTRTNHLQTGGSLALQLNGENMRAGVWDGGPIRPTHQEFQGRISIGDGNTTLNGNSFHMTHVTGTVAAAGVNAEAKGMAPFAEVNTFDWGQDAAEVIQEITSNGLLLSNHSYGIRASTSPTWFAGAYSNQARIWDVIMYNAPYYLMVTAAGNEGMFTNPDALALGLDKLTGNKNTKNNLVVANALDANVNPNGQLVSVQINMASSQGPTDDFRIKPDITGNGTFVFSSTSQTDSSYGSFSGTSMASPNVMGSLLLIQQYSNQLYQRYLKSATLKGLACHTADDAGAPGPDPVFGWGLLNARNAALTLKNNGLNTWITEETLLPNQTMSWQFMSDGQSPLWATICWTDAPGEAVFEELNNPSPVLINDLDLRIVGPNGVELPWRISTNNPSIAEQGDNIVDPIERIQIQTPTPGLYTLHVSHKGNLFDNKQDFSLIVSGVVSNIAFAIQGQDDIICAGQNITKSLSIQQNHSLAVSFSAVSLPQGVSATFQTINPTTALLTLTGTNTLDPGIYQVSIQASDGFETEIRHFSFRVFSAVFEEVQNQFPLNGADHQPRTVQLSWATNSNVESYRLQVSLNPSFEVLLKDEILLNNLYLLTGLASQTVYYWRVIPQNRCSISSLINTNSFKTGWFDCSFTYIATDFENAIIGDFANAIATVPVQVSDSISIADISVEIEVLHTWVQDMTLFLRGPSAASPEIILMEEACGSENDIAVTYDDNGGEITCLESPAISGIIAPKQTLSGLNEISSQGQWTLRVLDKYNNDGGEITAFKLNLCANIPNENALSLIHQTILAPQNSQKVITPNEVLAALPFGNATPVLYTLTSLPALGMLQLNNQVLQIGHQWTQNDIDAGNLMYINSLSQNANDAFEVDIEVQPGHWLANQNIFVEINGVLSTDTQTLPKFTYFPNPTKNEVFVQLDYLTENINLRMYDISGRLLKIWPISETKTTIHLGEVPAGIYLFELQNKTSKNTFKIIKNER